LQWYQFGLHIQSAQDHQPPFLVKHLSPLSI